MSQANYTDIPNQELRQYFLRHREDKLALRAYLDRLVGHLLKVQKSRCLYSRLFSRF